MILKQVLGLGQEQCQSERFAAQVHQRTGTKSGIFDWKDPQLTTRPQTPTEGDMDSKSGGQTLKQKAEQALKNNPTALGDPVSLKAETSDSEPTEEDRGARGTSQSSGKPKM
jgi:hypothetical protein